MPEQIPHTNFVTLFEDEFALATNGDQIDGPQLVRVLEIDSKVVQVQGSRNLGPNQKEEAKWEVQASTVEDFVQKIQNKT